jgi:hypothetical protein
MAMKNDRGGVVGLLEELEETVKVKLMDVVQHPEQLAVLAAAAERMGIVPQTVALDAFCHLKFGGKNFDQAAGFKRAMKALNLHGARLPESKWHSLLEEFQNRRIGG